MKSTIEYLTGLGGYSPYVAGFIFLFLLITFYRTQKRIKIFKILWVLSRIILSFGILFLLLDIRLSKFIIKERKPSVSVIIDESLSMNVKGAGGNTTRFERFDDLLNKLLQEEGIYTFNVFSSVISKINPRIIENINPQGLETNLSNVLRWIIKTQSDYDAYIIYTDGIDTSAESPVNLLKKYRESLKKKVVFLYPDEKDMWDVYIKDVEVPNFVYTGEPFELKVKIGAKGKKKKRNIVVQLWGERGLITAKDKEVKGGEVKFKFTSIIEKPGERFYEIRVLGGDPFKENNFMWIKINSIKKKIRVIHLAGKVSWDVRFLRKLLKDDPRIDLVTFIILRAPEDIFFVRSDELSLIPFPGRELFIDAIKNFDIVILQDFPYRPYITPFYFENIAKNIKNGNLSLLFVGGEETINRGGYASSPVSKILPVSMYSPYFYPEFFKLEITPQGKGHYITSIFKKLDELPEVEGVIKGVNKKKGCLTLAKTADTPVIVECSPEKEGRRVYVGTDTLWLLHKFSIEKRLEYNLYTQLIKRIIRFLTGFEGKSGGVQIKINKNEFYKGEKVILKLEGDKKNKEGDYYSLELYWKRGDSEELTKRYSDLKINDEISIKDLKRGFFTYKLINREGRVMDKGEFVYSPYPDEVRDIIVNKSLIKLMDEIGKDRVSSISIREFKKESLKKVIGEKLFYTKKKVSEKRLWHNPFLFLLLFISAILDWSIRRKNGFK